jgi:hypothetical protein
MATILQLRRGTTVQHSTFTGAVGEVTVDTTKDTVVVHDGTTAGGKPLATEAYVTSAIQTKDNSDEITEGSTNLYFTNTRARAAFTASTGISITDGAISTSITQYNDASARGAISVTDSGGDGSLAYNNTTGVITYTGPSATDVRAHFSAGTGVTISSGQVSIGQAVGTTSNVTFNNATISGNLTVNGTTTTVNSTNISYVDNIIELHNTTDSSPLTVDDGKDIGIRFHYYKTADKHAFAGFANDSLTFEYIVDGTESGGVFSGTYGNFKGSGLVAVGSSSGTTTLQASAAASGTVTLPAATDTLVGKATTDTLTNKTISGASNTLSNIGNGSLTNSAITLAGTSVSLGGSFTATNMLDAIKTVDGTGSGLDADLLDGNSSAYFRINIYDAAGTLLN